MNYIVGIIVFIFICAQFKFLWKNLARMKEYKDIFAKNKSWDIVHDKETGFVSGIEGNGNKIFQSIGNSINQYLTNNSGSVIDFHLLKDSVDRHCEAVENDIHTLTPVPLYIGLAGTMLGVILGLGSLILTGSITDLLSSGTGNFGAAATGVNDLLTGVAIAMAASICGIGCTTCASLKFKERKAEAEMGKNTFLAWLQARLLPELPSDTSDALNKLVKNLNRFNQVFQQNVVSLGGVLGEVNQSYREQAKIVKTIQKMDVVKVSEANISVLHELNNCTATIQKFQDYIGSMHHYTSQLQAFMNKFEQESSRLQVLEEIRNFFTRNKGELSKSLGDMDKTFQKSLTIVTENAEQSARKLNERLEIQSKLYGEILTQQQDTFEKTSKRMSDKLTAAIEKMPKMESSLLEIAKIPAQLKKLIEKIDKSNQALATEVSNALEQGATGNLVVSEAGKVVRPAVATGFPKWMRWTIFVSVVLIALMILTNFVLFTLLPLF